MQEFLFKPLVEAALREDLRSGDITTQALIPAEARATAFLRTREDGIWCGLGVARCAFALLDPTATFFPAQNDGEMMRAGDTLLGISGDARAVLSAERVALNFAQRLSGIATQTRAYVQAIEGTKARLADTRKTTPGLRLLEKNAVLCGGGFNHRFALDDMILIKDNHIALCGGIASAVERARNSIGHAVKIEVECDSIAQVLEAVEARADIILLDNMPSETLKQAVEIVDGRALCEASGGITLQTIRAVAESGVDLISVGALTHGARAIDLGLDIEVQ
ncbi:MAG TPA: carboxylating nicotinate-nucleotide diphosphorylase [Abditibacteriaceae bacterium]|jgi:nicotinate-nucleotide pyrophosphorylase (carboxylating)